MKNIIKLLTIPLLILVLSSCGANQTEQSATSETTTEFITEATSIAATTTTVSTETIISETETTIKTISETETTTKSLEYAEVVHNYEREFYDFIELEDGFFDDVSNYENTLAAKEIKSDFEAYMAQNNDMLCFESFWIDSVVSDDFDGNSTEEAFIVVKGKLDFSELENDIKVFFENREYYNYSGLYFVSDTGEITRLLDNQSEDALWENIGISAMYIYPDMKQLVVYAQNTTYFAKTNNIYSYDGEKVTCVLALNDMWSKDNCFLNSDARVGIWNPVQPDLFYWNEKNFCYEYVFANHIAVDDFRKLLENSVVNNEEEYNEILKYTTKCQEVIGIANHIFVIVCDDCSCVVTLNEDTSLKINIVNPWIGAYADNVNCDIDYFEAVKNMIPVE